MAPSEKRECSYAPKCLPAASSLPSNRFPHNPSPSRSTRPGGSSRTNPTRAAHYLDRRTPLAPDRAAKLQAGRSARRLAADAWKKTIPGADVQFDDTVGSPRFVASPQSFLSPPDAAVGEITAQEAHRRAAAFVESQAAMFGFGAPALEQARVTRDFVTPHNGLRTTVWQQEVNGIPVFAATFQAHVTKAGALVNVASTFVPDSAQAAATGTPEYAQWQGRPPIKPEEAVTRAAAALGETVATEQVVAAAPAAGLTQQQTFHALKLLEIGTAFTWLPIDESELRLCWEVTFISKARGEMFRTLVDAGSGEPLLRHRLTEYLTPASYRVYTSDSPSPHSPGDATPGTTQPAVVSRALVTLSALDTTASPNGWIDDGVNETRGNNVDAHLDLNADNVADTPRPQGSPNRVFDFSLDLTLAPSTYRDAAVTNLLYWNNYLHDRYYQLGFTEGAGNFQIDNFSRGGVGNDAVQADAQDGSGTNNANFSTPSDGSPGRMQMYIFTGPAPDRDGDFDSEIVIHEYTHGLSNRLVGGGVGISALQTRGMGEGWSDFYALCILSDPADDPNAVYACGAYASYQFSGLAQNYYYGIRRYPYCTDLTKNPLTFRDLDPGQISLHTGVPRSSAIGNTADEVHNQGELWCMTLWEARAQLIASHGTAAGNDLILQLVTDGMKLAPANPTFLQARDAILQADLVDNAGANLGDLWIAFAKRGLGAAATSPASSTTYGVVENFDLPDDLVLSPVGLLTATATIGSTPTPGAQVYTLTNKGTKALNWTASKTQSWLTLAPAAGTLAAGAKTQVTATFASATTSLQAGTYQDTLTFLNSTSGMRQTRAVQLTQEPVARTLFTEDWESGSVKSAWTLSGTSTYRTVISTANLPHGGTHHLLMDSSVEDSYARNEATLTLDLAGKRNLQLLFWVKMFSDEPDGPPAKPFLNGADFDGVAISADGTTWYEVQSLRSLSGEWQRLTVDLDAALTDAGLSYNSTFKIRFNHYDNYPIETDGFALDDIQIVELVKNRVTITAPATVLETAGTAQGTVTLTPAPTVDVTVTLASDRASEVSVPSSVTVLAGQGSANFSLGIADNALLDGTRTATLTATATDFDPGTWRLEVQDNETATLSFNVPNSTVEGVSDLQGSVSLRTPAGAPVTVLLSATPNTELQLPASVTIPTGQTTASFNMTPLDDGRLDGTVAVTLTAHVANWTDAVATVAVLDNELPTLSLSLPGSVRESSAGQPATVRTGGTLLQPLTVALASSVPGRLTVPATVTIPAGSSMATFTVTPVNNTLADGAQALQVTAAAAGFTGASGTLTVMDDDADHFSISPIASPQTRNAPFAVKVTALDSQGAVMPSYASSVSLSSTVAITPTTSGTWVNGTWTGQLTASAYGTGVVLTASDGHGHTGTSNAFDVTYSAMTGLKWSPIASPQGVDAPFPATLQAVDAAGNLVPSFTGTADLRAVLTPKVPETGQDTDTTSYPFYGYYRDTRIQTIYLASELGGAAPWSALSLNVASSSASVFQNFTVRLKHTNLTTPTTYFEKDGWVEVYRGTVAPQTTGWLTLPFNTTFLYDGTSNLMVDLSFDNPATVNSAAVFYTYGTYRAVFGYSDGTTGDPRTWSGVTNGASTTGALLNLRFTPPSSPPVPIQPAVTGAFVGGQWSGAVSVPLTASSLQLRASTPGIDQDSNAFSVTAAAPPSESGNVFTEDFESGTLNTAYWKVTGTGNFHTQVTGSYSPHGGTRHLAMDSTSGSARNEATLTLNLSGRTGLKLNFWAAGYNDEPDGPPASPFLGGADFDGVAISVDGNTWWEVQSLRSLSSTYTFFTVDLDAALAAHGLAASSAVRIRFNQYDDNPLPTDGIVIDDIKVTATALPSSLALALTLPAQVTEGAGVVSGRVSRTTNPAAALEISLSSKSPGKVTVPASVTIPAGQTSATFPLTVLDDAAVDGTKTVVITGTAPGVAEFGAALQVLDNESGTFTLDLPAAPENAGHVLGKITVSPTAVVPLVLNVVSGDPLQVPVPATVYLPAGAASTTFPLTVQDDLLLNGDRTVPISVSLTGWPTATASLQVQDDELRTLALSLPGQFREGDLPKTGQVTLGGVAVSATVVSLLSSDPTAVVVPGSVTVPAGQSSASFTITVVDDALADGPQPFTLTASAAGLTSATASATVQDDDAHHFTVAPIGSSELRKGPVSVVVTACDNQGKTIRDYQRTLTVTASGESGPLVVTVASGSSFVNGVWSGTVTIDALASAAVLTVSDGQGHTGSSNPFALVAGTIDHLEWGTVASPQALDTPFPVTVRAIGANGAVVSAFGGSADLVLLSPSMDAVLGTGTTTTTSMLNTYYQDGRSSSLYLASEMGGAARLTALSLNVTSLSSTGENLANLTIRLKHTTLTTTNSSSTWDNSGWTQVYQASPTISASGWVTFLFTTPFDYNGTSNLLVDLSFDRASTNNSYTYVQATIASGAFTAYAASSSTSGSPLNWTNSPYPTSTSTRADLRFSSVKEVPIRPVRTGAFTNGEWSGAISLPVGGSALSLRARAGQVQGTSNSFDVTIPTVLANATVFAEDFEGSTLNPANWTVTGTGNFHTITNTAYTPHAGSRHLTMDASPYSGNYARNEATLTLDLAGRSGVKLQFWAKDFSEQADGPPASPFPSTGANFDGVAISADGGTNWYEVQSLRVLTAAYALYTVDLDAALAAHGLAYSQTFKIRFNEYGYDYLPYSGIAIDDLVITSKSLAGFALHVPAQVTEGDGTVSASVTLDAAAAVDTVIALTSSASAKLTVPATVTVPAGQTSATFDLEVLDDTISDGDRVVSIMGTIAGHPSGSALVTVIDGDPLPFTFKVPATVSENAGTATGVLTLADRPSGAIAIGLSSSASTRLQVPTGVVLPPGAQSVNVPLTIINNTKIEGPQTVTLTASSSGGGTVPATVQIIDDETPQLNLSVTLSTYNSMSEGTTASATVRLTGTLDRDLLVTLNSSNPARLTIPAAITVTKGQQYATFTVTAPDDSLQNGSQAVTLTATAAGFTSGTSVVTVTDNDVHHFSFSTIASGQRTGMPFYVMVTAKDVNDATISNYSGTVALTAAGDGGAVTVAPGAMAFSYGYFSDYATAYTAGTNVKLTATAAGVTGTSNAFAVLLSPALTLAPTSLSLTVGAGSTAASSFAVKNTGGGTLSWSLGATTSLVGTDEPGPEFVSDPTASHPAEGSEIYRAVRASAPAAALVEGASATADPPLQAVLNSLNANYLQVRGAIPNRYAFTEGASSYYIATGGNSMYYYGNYLSTNLSSYLGYSENAIVGGYGLGPSGAYFTRKYDGLWVFAADINGLTSFSTSGTLGNGGSGSTDFAVLTLIRNGVTYRGLVKRVYGASTPSVNHLIIVQDNGSVTYASGTTASSDSHIITGLTGITRLYYLLYAGTAGAYIDNTAALAIMGQFLDAIGEPAWLKPASTSGTVAAGGSQTVALAIDTAKLTLGTHLRTLMLTSDDPARPQASLPVSLTVVGAPSIAVSPSGGFTASGHRGGPFSPAAQTFTLTNGGGLPVNWSTAQTASWLQLTPSSGTIPAGGSATVLAGFAPGAAALPAGSYAGTVTFTNTTNGAGTTTCPVALIVNPVGDLQVSPGTGWDTAGPLGGPLTSDTQTYQLTNAGDAALTWAVSKNAGWLTLSGTTGGTLAPGESATVIVTVSAAALGYGSYTDHLVFANTSTGRGNAAQPVTVSIQPGAPVLASLPPVSGGTSRTISWSPVVGADGYEVQAAATLDFASPVSSGWISGTQYTFGNLIDGVTYFYRVRGSHFGVVPAGSWSQASQAELATGEAVSVSTSAVAGSVVLQLGAGVLTENFDEAGTAWSSTIFTNTSTGTATRTALASSGPNTRPALPVNQLGDLEGSMAGRQVSALLADNDTNRFTNGSIEAYFTPLDLTHPQSAGLLLRAAGSGPALNGYGAYIFYRGDGTAQADFTRIIDGHDDGPANRFNASTSSFTVGANENLHARFSISGDTLTLRLWRVTVRNFVVTETPIPLVGDSTTLTATDAAYSAAGLAGLCTTTLTAAPIVYDDVRITGPAVTAFAPSGTLTSPVVEAGAGADWGVLSYTLSPLADGTAVTVDVLDASGSLLAANVSSGTTLNTLSALAGQTKLRLRANLSTAVSSKTPQLDDWALTWTGPHTDDVYGLWSVPVTSRQDATPPELALESSEVALLSAITLQGTATDPAGVAAVSLNGQAVTTTDAFAHWSLPATLGPGMHQLVFLVRDQAVPPNTGTRTLSIFRSINPADRDGDGLPDAWETLHGLDSLRFSGRDGPHGDPDGDGLDNLFEYAFDLDPNVADAAEAIKVGAEINPVDGKSYMTVRYRHLIDPAAGTYTPEISDDLQHWSAQPEAWEEVLPRQALPDGRGEVVALRIKPALGAPEGAKRFVRVHYTAP